MKSGIKTIKAREVLDSRGNPTVEVDLTTDYGLFRAIVPSGASTGTYEAIELRDGDMTRYLGKGMQKAVANINQKISPQIIGLDCDKQTEVDSTMIELDGTEYKSNLGANAILAVSMAACKAGAIAKGIPLYQHIANLAGTPKFIMPVPSFNVINGGHHAGNKLAMQEFMLLPIGAKNFKESMRFGVEVYQILKNIIKVKYGSTAINVGDEGGFAPNLQDAEEVFKLLVKAIETAGYTEEVKIGIDVAASEFYENGIYDLDFKNPKKRKTKLKSGEELIDFYEELIKEFPVISIEDPFDQEDWRNHSKLTLKIGKNIQIVGDDLLVTNPRRIKKAKELKAVNALLLKINQIGTVTESIQAYKISQAAGWGVMVSHRSGETEDSFIADFAVGLSTGQIKAGAPCRSERLCKYNQLMRIEEELSDKSSYAGKKFRKPI